jgi:hypothetical protein
MIVPCSFCEKPFNLSASRRRDNITCCSWACRRELRLKTSFWKRVNRNGPVVRPELGECWEWTGNVVGNGYGRWVEDGRLWSAHRYAWFRVFGKVPTLCILHKCDNRICVRPEHLFEGTRSENTADMVAKGRAATGTRNGSARLTEAEIPEIRGALASGATLQSLADEYGVCIDTISKIKLGRTWRHVPSAAPGSEP